MGRLHTATRAECEVIAVDRTALHGRTFYRRPHHICGRARMHFHGDSEGTLDRTRRRMHATGGPAGRVLDRLFSSAGNRGATAELDRFKRVVHSPSRSLREARPVDAPNPLGRDVAQRFGTSRGSCRIRSARLGYDNARGYRGALGAPQEAVARPRGSTAISSARSSAAAPHMDSDVRRPGMAGVSRRATEPATWQPPSAATSAVSTE
jgi:hypothetical protein